MKITDRLSLKNILKAAVVAVVLYNMILVPLAPIAGITLPPLIIDEATKTILFLTTLG